MERLQTQQFTALYKMLYTLDWGHCALHGNMTADHLPMDNVNFCGNIQILSKIQLSINFAHLDNNGSIP